MCLKTTVRKKLVIYYFTLKFYVNNKPDLNFEVNSTFP